MPLSLPPLWVVILVILLFIFNILKSNSVIKIKESVANDAVKKITDLNNYCIEQNNKNKKISSALLNRPSAIEYLRGSLREVIKKSFSRPDNVPEGPQLEGVDFNNLRHFRYVFESNYNSIEKNLQFLFEENALLKMSLLADSPGYPTLIDLLERFEKTRDDRVVTFLKTKRHFAYKAADIVKEETRRRRDAEKDRDHVRALLEYYAHVFPSMEDDYELISEPDDVPIADVDEDEDQVKRYLTEEEYANLSVTERNQRALDRFWDKRKSKRAIGKLYEQYLGYLFEQKGYDVEYFGIKNGLGDLGRDLICRKRDEEIIVQCKHWSKSKTIYEKHIFQLFGTLYQYRKEHAGKQVRGAFYTSTSLSPLAKNFAREFDIEIIENMSLQRYPIIKCNIGKDGEKIYHLPFDLQYNVTKINCPGECYCTTVAEAEARGFRRAYRWRGEKS